MGGSWEFRKETMGIKLYKKGLPAKMKRKSESGDNLPCGTAEYGLVADCECKANDDGSNQLLVSLEHVED